MTREVHDVKNNQGILPIKVAICRRKLPLEVADATLALLQESRMDE